MSTRVLEDFFYRSVIFRIWSFLTFKLKVWQVYQLTLTNMDMLRKARVWYYTARRNTCIINILFQRIGAVGFVYFQRLPEPE